jgi:microcystin-dependent protein
MAKKIEILENTLLKLLVRRGDDVDRKNVILSEGELGYTADGKRLYVGDGQTAGGIVTGNKYKGSSVDHTTITDAEEGDYAHNSTSNILYIKTTASWLSAGRILTASDGTITINDADGTIVVGSLSANNIHADALGNSLEIDTNGRVALSSTNISVDRITPNSTTYLNLPQKLSINAVDYTFPIGGVGSNKFLGTDVSGNLTWKVPDQASTFFFNSTAGPIPIGTIMPYVSANAAPEGWLLCNGQTVAAATYPDLYTIIGSEFGGNATNFKLPNYTDSALYGVASDPAGSTTLNIGTGTGSLSAKGALFIIKAIPDSLAQSTIQVKSPLALTVNGIAKTSAVSPLSGNLVLSTGTPGITANSTAGNYIFITLAEYTKFWLTGSGSKGGVRTGGAAATVTGILSAPIGTQFDITVGAGASGANGASGNPSFISHNSSSVELARSFGAVIQPAGVVPDSSTNTGNLSTNGTGLAGGQSAYVLGGHVIDGGRGGWDTNGGGEDVGGTASFWGSDNVAGAGAGGHNGDTVNTAAGLVKFEWGL